MKSYFIVLFIICLIVLFNYIACEEATEPEKDDAYNYALQFDGEDDYVQVDDNVVLRIGTSDFTIEAWIYPTATTGNFGFNAIISKHSGEDGTWIFRVTNNSETGFVPKLSFATFDPASHYYNQTELNFNTWYHVAVKREGTIGTFYLNGVIDGTFINSKELPSTSPMYISGQGNVDDERFTGVIDEVRIWMIARTKEEILADMNREIAGDSQGLVCYWRFNEGSGNTINDQTPNNNHGILYGGVKWVSR